MAGFALATQSRFPPARTQANYVLYQDVLRALDRREWTRKRSGSRTFAVNARNTLTGSDVEERLLKALYDPPNGIGVCIIDLRPAVVTPHIVGTYPGTFRRVADVLAEYLDEHGDAAHVVVIVPELDAREDVHFERFSSLSDRGSITILDAGGEVWSTRFTDPDADNLRRAMASALGRDTLEQKMIRRLGLFPEYDEEDRLEGYTRYFYDGRYCHRELTQLLYETFAEIVEPGEPSAIVYEDPPSHWLARPMLDAVRRLEREDQEYLIDTLSLAELQAPEQERPGRKVRTAIALLAMVDRKRALTRLVRGIHAWAEATILVHGVSVLRAPDLNRPREIEHHTIDGGKVELRWFMAVNQREVTHPEEFVPDVAYYAAESDRSDRFLTFTSGDFWLLAEEATFIKERDKPPGRAALRQVPDLRNFIETNGPWIAQKVEACIELETENRLKATDVSLALVADEEAASQLSDILQATLGNAPLRIPRCKIEAWENGSPGGKRCLNRWRENGEKWLEEITSAPSSEVVILDEFAYGGGSMAGMASLLRALGRHVRFVLVVAAFSRSSLDRKLGDHTRWRSLYTTEWQHPDAKSRIEHPGRRART